MKKHGKNSEVSRVYARARVGNRTLVSQVTKHAREAASRVHWDSPLPNPVANIHHYLAGHIRYRAEGEDQIIRRPSALVALGVGDCKSTAVFAASLLKAHGVPVQLAFVKTADRPWWSHVYVIADGVVVDPLLPLGDECQYVERKLIEL
ncbi:MAG: transglutaminase-like domain-containing protein [Actinomycetia bacterium]|nr:transglutaminase-like domain-containing protein [Actinomycetes bacterium]